MFRGEKSARRVLGRGEEKKKGENAGREEEPVRASAQPGEVSRGTRRGEERKRDGEGARAEVRPHKRSEPFIHSM